MCRKCGEPWKLMPPDQDRGLRSRKTFLSGKVPEGHGFKVNGVFVPMNDLHCDLCDTVLTGHIVVAVSVWRGQHDMGFWEPTYGRILSPEAVAAYDCLEGRTPCVEQS
jgi:hypothetical protein